MGSSVLGPLAVLAFTRGHGVKLRICSGIRSVRAALGLHVASRFPGMHGALNALFPKDPLSPAFPPKLSGSYLPRLRSFVVDIRMFSSNAATFLTGDSSEMGKQCPCQSFGQPPDELEQIHTILCE